MFGDLTKLSTLAQVVGNAKSIVKELKSKHMLVNLLLQVKKEEDIHVSLKVPITTK